MVGKGKQKKNTSKKFFAALMDKKAVRRAVAKAIVEATAKHEEELLSKELVGSFSLVIISITDSLLNRRTKSRRARPSRTQSESWFNSQPRCS
jgi:hypothetical protein